MDKFEIVVIGGGSGSAVALRGLVQKDLDISIVECKVLFGGDTWDEFPDEVQEVCVNMMFNLGRPRYSRFSKHLAALKEHDWATAGAEARDSRWHTQVGDRAERLCQRLEALA